MPAEAASLADDGSKLERARENMMTMATERGEEKTVQGDIKCVMFDSRIDKTKVQYYDEETGKYFPHTEPEDHYTMMDGDGQYLQHFTKPVKEDHDSEDEMEDKTQDEKDEDTVRFTKGNR